MKNAKWITVELGKHIDLLCGFAFKSKDFTDNPKDIPLVKGANVHQGYIDWADSKYWSRNNADQYSRYFLETDDVVLAMDRPWIEAGLKYSWIRKGNPKALLVQRVARMRGINGLNSKYLRFIIGCNQFTAYIKPIVTGINVPHISADQIKAFKFQLPPEEHQRKIASILSAYDDQIENNTRRIAILEEMAQRIYKEWFVNFRFPGHENAKFVDSPLGKIPEGWKVVSLKHITSKIGSGSTPRGGKEVYKTSGISLIRSLNIYDNQFEQEDLAYINEEQAAELDNVTIERRDILLNITGASVARCCMVPSYLLPARVNQHVAIIRVDPDLADPFFVVNSINSERHKRQILTLAQGGATREALTKETISNYEIVLPKRNVYIQYGIMVADLFEQREVLQKKNRNLRTTRDLLLPKLISGRLDVEDLGIDTLGPLVDDQT
jgi:type I restriction enzyme S subunit